MSPNLDDAEPAGHDGDCSEHSSRSTRQRTASAKLTSVPPTPTARSVTMSTSKNREMSNEGTESEPVPPAGGGVQALRPRNWATCSPDQPTGARRRRRKPAETTEAQPPSPNRLCQTPPLCRPRTIKPAKRQRGAEDLSGRRSSAAGSRSPASQSMANAIGGKGDAWRTGPRPSPALSARRHSRDERTVRRGA